VWQYVDMTEPSPQLRQASTAHHRAERQLERTRATLHMAIAADLRAGVRQAELVKVTGLSREHIRRIARAAGLEAEPRAS
jgi:hypothetical protein